MIRNEELSYFKYWVINNFYNWAMSQTFPLNKFKWVEETFSIWGRFHKKL